MANRVHDWKQIQVFHDAGHSFVECRRHFGFTHTAWVRAIRRGDLVARFRKSELQPVDPKDRRRIYDWSAVQRYYDEGHTVRECRAHFGFCAMAWSKAKRRGEIISRGNGMAIADLLRVGVARTNVKIRLLSAGLLKNECAHCGLTHWRGLRLSLHIDHINGVKQDHRLENLRMLCPNCHSQTATYGGRNAKRRRGLQEPPPFV